MRRCLSVYCTRTKAPRWISKRDQYTFRKGTALEKSELLKDILGFANAWRRTDAYILIGVDEVRGGRSKVVGVTEHLDDHSLQQFVHSRTNRPLGFAYEVFESYGRPVGIIRIYQEDRPVYLNADYGKLRKHEVYVRRGSATDPRTPASPDEIARMSEQGQMAASSPQLVVAFADPDRDEVLGAVLSVQGENCSMPPADEIPKLGAVLGDASWHFTRTNSDYYVRFAEYTHIDRMAFRTRLVLLNHGSVEARRVLVEIAVPKGGAIDLRSCVPRAPRRTYSPVDHLGTARDLVPVSQSGYPGAPYVDEDDERYKMEINFLDIQPGRRVLSDAFYLIVRSSGTHRLKGWVYAANLPKAEAAALKVEAEIPDTSMTVSELVALARSRG